MAISFIQTQQGINFICCGRPITLSSDHKKFDEIVTAIQGDKSEEEVLALLEGELRKVEEAVHLTPEITLKGGQLLYKGRSLNNILAEQIRVVHEQGYGLMPLVRLLESALRSPYETDMEKLYVGLSRAKLSITSDGDFLAYIPVQPDYKDENGVKITLRTTLKGDAETIRQDAIKKDSTRMRVMGLEEAKRMMPGTGHIMVCKVSAQDVVLVKENESSFIAFAKAIKVVAEHQVGNLDKRGIVISDFDDKKVRAINTYEIRGYEWEREYREGHVSEGVLLNPDSPVLSWDEARDIAQRKLEDFEVVVLFENGRTVKMFYQN